MKFLLTNLFLTFIMAGATFAQSLQLSTENEGVLDDGQVITINATPDTDLMQALVDVENTSDESITVEARRVVHEELDESSNYFCWGTCYSPSVDTSLIKVTLDAGEVTSEFYGDYEPHGNVGTTRISYFFYDETNHDDVVEVEVHFVTQVDNSSSITLSTEDHGELEHEQTITVEGTLDEEILIAHINVRNDDELPMDILVRRVEHDTVPGSINYFCWGTCYANSVDTSLMTVTLEPGETTDEFSCDYEPQGNEGTTTVSYYFYDERNPDNEIGITIKFVVESSGIEEETFVSGLTAYPNPTSDQLNLDFILKEIDDACITVHNMLGAVVYQKRLDNRDNRLHLNTRGFQNGVYFYTIHNNNRMVASEKFIISH